VQVGDASTQMYVALLPRQQLRPFSLLLPHLNFITHFALARPFASWTA